MRTSITINIMAKCNQLLLLFSLSYCDLKDFNEETPQGTEVK
jgi:hypothetical protein